MGSETKYVERDGNIGSMPFYRTRMGWPYWRASGEVLNESKRLQEPVVWNFNNVDTVVKTGMSLEEVEKQFHRNLAAMSHA